MGIKIGQSTTDKNSALKTNTRKGNGSVKQLMAKASKGKGGKGGMASKLLSGTRKTGKQPTPSMAKGPLRP